MELIVCLKQILDPEAPPDSYTIDQEANRISLPPDIAPVISTFDEIALEAALRLKDTHGGKITALSMGNNFVPDVIKKPLAVGADELILLDDESFEDGDAWSNAYALAEAIKKIGQYDIIFCGRQAADWDSGLVGAGVAELLGLPSVTLAKKVEINGKTVTVERVAGDGIEIIEVEAPCLITVSNELGELRLARLKGVRRASKMQPTVWKPEDIGADPERIGANGRLTTLHKLFRPVKETQCEIIEGEDVTEAAVNLSLRLREAKIL
jgi:electron transfer flavoprotein beta subunit